MPSDVEANHPDAYVALHVQSFALDHEERKTNIMTPVPSSGATSASAPSVPPSKFKGQHLLLSNAAVWPSLCVRGVEVGGRNRPLHDCVGGVMSLVISMYIFHVATRSSVHGRYRK